jgi:outer membrane protein assembly factor BamA
VSVLLLSLFLSLGFSAPSIALLGDSSTILKDSATVSDSLSASLALFCPQDSAVIDDILFIGNNKTRQEVLRRELNIREGSVLSRHTLAKKLEENRLRLFNLQLFHWVKYEVWCQDGKLKILFALQERWYLWPAPVLQLADRNLNAWLDKKDFRRLDYGLYLRYDNFRGRNERLRVHLLHGFNRRYEFQYIKPYLTERYRKIGGSVAASFYQSRTLEYNTIGNKLVTFRDENAFPIQRQFVSAGLIYRQNVQKQTALTLSLHQQTISDSVFRLNPRFFYKRTRRQYVEVDLTRVVNLRNTFSYPLSGSYLKASISQKVFFNPDSPPVTTLYLKLADYSDLNRGYYYSYGGEIQTMLGAKPSFADNTAFGYKSFVRGYELFVIGGQHYALLKQGLSKKILGIDRIVLPFLSNPKFNQIPLSVYVNVFADGGYVVDQVFKEEDPLSNRLLVGSGVGLHIVTFYDRVIRLEYSINREWNRGFFIHTSFPF